MDDVRTLRGKYAIVGIAELPSRRTYPGRSTYSLCVEAARIAIQDAGLKKQNIDGLITRGEMIDPTLFAEVMGIAPAFLSGVVQHGASPAHGVVVAAAAINAGMCDTALVVMGATRDPESGIMGIGEGGGRGPSIGAEWVGPFGTAAGAGGGYGLMKQRHMYEYGTTEEQFAQIAVNQRFNAMTNPNAVFQGQALNLDDVLNSRYTNDPLHILESVMPCGGANAVIVTTADRAKTLPNRPVYILGAGGSTSDHEELWQAPRVTTTPVVVSARRALEMSGYAPKDIQLAEFYD